MHGLLDPCKKHFSALKLSDNAAFIAIAQIAIHLAFDTIRDKTNGPIAKRRVNPTGVIAAGKVVATC
jgi:hypothetical protein